MFVSSNPLAIAAAISLATVIVYEWRYDFLCAIDRLGVHVANVLLVIRVFWWAPALMGAGYAIDRWLGWQWLLVGFARMLGASVILVCLFFLWTEVLRPKAQKLSLRIRASRL